MPLLLASGGVEETGLGLMAWGWCGAEVRVMPGLYLAYVMLPLSPMFSLLPAPRGLEPSVVASQSPGELAVGKGIVRLSACSASGLAFVVWL